MKTITELYANKKHQRVPLISVTTKFSVQSEVKLSNFPSRDAPYLRTEHITAQLNCSFICNAASHLAHLAGENTAVCFFFLLDYGAAIYFSSSLNKFLFSYFFKGGVHLSRPGFYSLSPLPLQSFYCISKWLSLFSKQQ